MATPLDPGPGDQQGATVQITPEQMQALAAQLAATLAPQPKPWWLSKTLWVNAAALIVAAAADHVGALSTVLPGGVYAWLAFGLPVANAALRWVTTTGVRL